MLVWDPTVLVSTTGDSPLTVIASETEPSFIGASILVVWPCRTITSSRIRLWNPWSVILTV